MSSPLIIDNREGSSPLYPLLRSRGLPAELGRMAYGDISFVGNGPEGLPIPVGIEYKKVMDVLKCITDGRFAAHQLPGLLDSYAVPWLLVEGEIRADRVSGALQRKNLGNQWVGAAVGARGFMYRDYVHWVQSVVNICGIRVHHTRNSEETVAWLASTYTWWCSKEWHEHKSLAQLHKPVTLAPTGIVSFSKPSLLRKIAATLPGIGLDKSAIVATYFGTITAMFEADESDWRNIPGIGPTIAKRVWAAIHESK